MSTRLVASRIKAKVKHKSTRIFGGIDISSTECIGEIVAVERGLRGLKDTDTVGQELQSINGLSGYWIHYALNDFL